MSFRSFSVSSILVCSLFITASPAQVGGALTLSGKVVLSDGSPLPAPAKIELRCGQNRQPQQFTDKKGNFSFRIGGTESQQMIDASVANTVSGDKKTRGESRLGLSNVSLTGCHLQAALAGYSSSGIDLGTRSSFESPDVGTIILTPLAKDTAVFVSARTALAPKKAKAAYDKAEKELAKERPDNAKAAKDLQDAVEQYPEFAAAWQRLGTLKLDSNDTNGASEAFRKAIAADPNFVPPCISLASLELQLRKPDEAVKLADQALKLAPDLPEAHYYRGLANLSLGRHDDAEASLLVVQRSAEANRFPRTHVALGGIFAQKGDIPKAAAEFRRYLELESSSKVADSIRARLAEWQAAGKLN